MPQADEIRKNQVCVNGRWVAAKPIPAPLLMRLRDAWAVLTGKARAIEFYGQE